MLSARDNVVVFNDEVFLWKESQNQFLNNWFFTLIIKDWKKILEERDLNVLSL